LDHAASLGPKRYDQLAVFLKLIKLTTLGEIEEFVLACRSNILTEIDQLQDKRQLCDAHALRMFFPTPGEVTAVQT